MLNNKSILITGGTGTFGKAFVKKILHNYKIKRLVVFSRDEFKQYEMSKTFPTSKYPCMRYFIGDVRDKDRLNQAFANIDIVIHAAALKQVDTAEYNPFEYISTNIMGAENVIRASLNNNIKQVIALSTDKAASPINLYGATKLCSDKLFIAANNITGSKKIKFSVVRYGNVLGSRGSVVPMFLSLNGNEFPITDKRMTRFNITIDQAVNFVLTCMKHSFGGEIFVPKIPSYRIIDVVKAINPNCKIKIIGIRPGEKLHEEMITLSDSFNSLQLKNFFVILPRLNLSKNYNKTQNEYVLKNYYIKKKKAKRLPENFSYNSLNNPKYLSIKEIKKIIKDNFSK
jgi:UDP-N-acetylglucosamine 4,6-dehydratase/5-epimerase